MLSKIDFSQTVRAHLETLSDSRGQALIRDRVLFFGVPILVTLVCWLRGKSLSPALVSLLLTTFSIFAALLLNLIVLVYEMIRRSPKAGVRSSRDVVVTQLFANVSFGVLVCLLAIVMLLVHEVIGPSLLRSIVSAVVSFLTVNFILTLLLVLKRVHVLMEEEVNLKE